MGGLPKTTEHCKPSPFLGVDLEQWAGSVFYTFSI